MNLFSKKHKFTTSEVTSEVVLEHANKKAEAIIREAVDSAQRLLTQTQLLTKELQDKAATGMSTAVETQTKRLDSEMTAAVDKILNDFDTNVQKQLIDSAKLLEEKTGAEFQKVQAELAEYKKEKQAHMDTLIERKVAEIAQKVLGKAIDMKTHESLIMEAIEKAGKDGFFN